MIDIIMMNILMNILFNNPFIILIIFVGLISITIYDMINTNISTKKKVDTQKTINLNKMNLDFITQPRPRM